MINNFTEIYNPELLKQEKDEYKRLKSNYTILSERIEKIEKYYDKNNETFTDCNFTITIMKFMIYQKDISHILKPIQAHQFQCFLFPDPCP